MILFKTIKFRNFLSTGNQFTEVNLNKDKTTLIVGTNGSGKSTLLDALCFVLFNKAFRKITKNQLINSTNEKDCVVEIGFSIGKIDWKIIRGIKPNIFEIYKDGKLLDQSASSNEQQQWLEDTVLKLNYKSFTQIVILGSASFVPFMQLSTSHRREIVEDLLDIKVFSSMNTVVKEKIKFKNDKVKELSITKTLTEEKILMQKDFIKNIQEDGEKNILQKKEKIKSIKKTIKNLSKENDQKNSLIVDDLNIKLSDLIDYAKKLKQLTDLKGKITQKIKTITDDHKFFMENTVCPTCTQNIEESFRLNKIEESQSKAKELKNGYSELTDAITKEEEREIDFGKISKEIALINNEISSNNFKIKQLNEQSEDLEQEIQEITNKLKDRNVERNLLVQLEQELDTVDKQRTSNREEVYYLEFVNQLLKDGGIKAKIIKKYLPLMNKQINKYLQFMDFYINFTFDEEFKEIIKSPIHEDFTYDSFSEGEKMRINLAILFTWREIAKIKNSVNTNILILDEVFDSSLDGNGIDYFSKIIRYVISDLNVFVISHKTDEMIDLFDQTLKFNKIKGFSKIIP
jgi:DNA repair exonuclease SbcCD ATPase subunit